MDRRTITAFVLIGILTCAWMYSWSWMQKRQAQQAEQTTQAAEPVEAPHATAETPSAPAPETSTTVAATASYLPAARAVRTDPTNSLRQD